MEGEEFYSFVERKRKEIDGLDVSDEVKTGLYGVVDEAITRHEETRLNTEKSYEMVRKIGKNLDEMENILADSSLRSQVILHDLECTLRELRGE
tara:strand:- start:61 stop:342 length:282 start_codon:yes stop_codon:yes gene_type:complete